MKRLKGELKGSCDFVARALNKVKVFITGFRGRECGVRGFRV